MTSVFSLVAAVAVAIVPTQARDATRAVTKLRGGDDGPAQVQAGQVDAKAFAGRTRIAVLPFVTMTRDREIMSQRTGMMDALLADLRYVPVYLVADRSEILASKAAIPSETDDLRSVKLSQELGVNTVIGGRVGLEGAFISLDLTMWSVADGKAKAVGSVELKGAKEEIYSLGDEALLKLLDAAKTTPPADRIEEIKKIPTKRFEARVHADDGFALLDSVLGKDSTDDAFVAANTKALEHAKAAIRADRNYVPAHMLRATCLFNLNKSTELKDCLESALGKNEPSRVDMLSSLELEGDYLTFHDGKYDEAAEKYLKILSFDPGNLHALWSLTGLYSGDYGAKDFAAKPKASDQAGKFAAQIVFAHPHSSAAQLFQAAPKK